MDFASLLAFASSRAKRWLNRVTSNIMAAVAVAARS